MEILTEQSSQAVPAPAPENVEQSNPSAEGAPAGEATPPPEPEKPRAPGAKERIDQLTARYREEQRVAAQERQAREAAEAELAAYRRQQERAQQFSHLDTAKPRIDQFQDLESYQQAFADWNLQRSVAVAQAQWEEHSQAQAAAQAKRAYDAHQQQQRVMQENAVLSTKLAPGEKAYSDFREVVGSPDVPSIRGTSLMEFITAADNTHHISYLLAKNPAEIHRLLSLPPGVQAREIYKLDQKFTGNGATSAPPPPPNRNGSSVSGRKDWSEMSTAEHAKAYWGRKK